MIQSVVLIIPAHLKDDANELAELLGHGPNNYSVPLSEDGQQPVTHYGLHTWAEQSFIDLLEADDMPVGLEKFSPVKESVISSIRTEMDNHWNDLLEQYNLQLVVFEDLD